jgi:hypothetical protein
MDRKTTRKVCNEIKKEINPLKILGTIKKHVPDEYFKANPVNSADTSGPKEVILSEYIVK